MTATQTKLRRGTSSQCDAMIPTEAEVVVDLSNDRLRLGDGVRLGGIVLPNSFDLQVNSFGFITAGGTANAITGDLVPALVTYSQPLEVTIKIANTNTGPVTINLNSLGTRNVYKISGGTISPLIAGDFIAGGIYKLIYDGTQFIVLGAMGGIVEVGQGELKTSQGTFTGLANLLMGSGSGVTATYRGSTVITNPAGSYGFNVEAYNVNDYLCGWWDAGRSQFGYVSGLIPWSSNSTVFPNSVNGRVRYITASPPYNLGDGEVGGFIFTLVNSSGEIVSHYAADAPPWAYNGPTNIRPSRQCLATGKKFRRVMKKRTFEQIMDGAPIEYKEEEITHKIKNADMKLIPHPFGEVPEHHHVVLLDPMDDTTRKIIDYQNSGGTDWTENLRNGKIEIGDECKRCGPEGVHIHKMKYKYTKKF